MRNLQRIDPDDAEEFDAETVTLLNRWAAHRLDVAEDRVERVLVEVTGGCGEGTCEFTTARAEVVLKDGRIFLGADQSFGLFIRDIVAMDVNPDGTESRPGYMWDLYSEDGRKVPPKPTPPKRAPATPTRPQEPEPGVSIRITQETADPYGAGLEATSRRTEVYTSRGWVDLREVVAVFEAT